MATKSGAGNLVYSVVAIAIIVLIVSTVAVPVIENADSQITSIQNNTSQRYTVVSSNNLGDLTISTASAGTFSINGELYTASLGSTPILQTTSLLLFYIYTSSTNYYIQMDDLLTPSVQSLTSMTIVGDSYTAVKRSDSSTISGTVAQDEKAYFISNTGSYGLFFPTADNPLFINNDSDLAVSTGSTILSDGTNSVSCAVCIRGTVNVMNQITAVTWTDGVRTLDITSANGAFAANTVIPIDNVTKQIVSVSVPISVVIDGISYSGTIVSSSVIAPIEYRAVTDSDSALINLIDIIPILLFLVPVTVAVRMIQTRRN